MVHSDIFAPQGFHTNFIEFSDNFGYIHQNLQIF